MIIQGDCLEVMKSFPDNHFSCIVTDPPYGLHFMGKDWDKFSKSICEEQAKTQFSRETKAGVIRKANSLAGEYDDRRNDEFQSFMRAAASEALRILKPSGHCLMFGAPRRYHRQVCALEDTGFEIRDCLMWLFGSGFPKSHNRFGIDGFGTALKPAYEPIIMAMKSCDGTFAQNAEKWGQAGINIDGCRVGMNGGSKRSNQANYPKNENGTEDRSKCWARTGHEIEIINKGRWPSNLLLSEEAAKMLDEQSGIQASRFFYCAKASSSERNQGLKEMPLIECQTGCGGDMPLDDQGKERDRFKKKSQNFHPTVKPLRLMEYLIKLVMPPKDGLLLDPFAGSGTTILAAKNLGFNAIGIEKNEEYCEIARKRLEDKPKDQMDLFS